MVIAGIGRTFSALGIYNYRLYWLGQLVSVSGTWMQTIAQSWLVLQLTNSALALGTLTMLRFLPVTLLTLVGGVLADRLPLRKTLFVSQSLSALQAFALAVLVLTHRITLWQLDAGALALGIINAFDTPTRQSFVAKMVGKERIQNAVALNSSLMNSARIIGPAIAGLAITAFGVGVLAQTLGVPAMILLMAGACIVGVLIVAWLAYRWGELGRPSAPTGRGERAPRSAKAAANG